MTRGLFGLVTTIVALEALAGLGPWRIDTDDLQAELQGKPLLGAGFDKVSTGKITFTALPFPRIEMKAPEFADAGGSRTLAAASLRGAVRLLPLVGGRLELADVSLIEPRLTIAEAATGSVLAQFLS